MAPSNQAIPLKVECSLAGGGSVERRIDEYANLKMEGPWRRVVGSL